MGEGPEIRRRVETEKQGAAAADFGISAGLCCQIVSGEVWNPAKYRIGTKGDEMRRRVYAAFDLGLRANEMLPIQLKHVDFKPGQVEIDGEKRDVFVIALPPQITRGGKTADFGRQKGLVWHTTRHEFVSRHAENTGDRVLTQYLARHKDLRTTQAYFHVRNARMLRAAVRRDR